jgi:transcriptional regulator of heat shock response
MIGNRLRLTRELRKRLCEKGAIAPNPQADKIFLIRQKLQESALLLISKRLQIIDIRKRILVYGSSPSLAQELRAQSEQVEDLVQLVEDWLNFLELLREKPTIKPKDLSPPLQRTLIALELQAQTHS